MKTKRFIAGAVCPSCGEMDTLRMFKSETGQQYRECVECNFSDVQELELKLKGELPEARISREETVLEDHVDVVRILGDSKIH